jgi:hypothetical protein
VGCLSSVEYTLMVFYIAQADDEFPPVIQNGDQDKLHF